MDASLAIFLSLFVLTCVATWGLVLSAEDERRSPAKPAETPPLKLAGERKPPPRVRVRERAA